MNQKKNKKIIIIAIVIILILIIFSGLAYAYMATDFLKSDKQLFFKYISQAIDSENGFIENELNQYYNKQKNSPYTNSGSLSVDISGPEEFLDKVEYTNNMDITFSGQVDNLNSKILQDISINYSDDVNLPFSFKKVGDIIGVMQTKYVGKKYITVNTAQLEDLDTNFDTTTMETTMQGVGKLGEISNVEISEEEMKHIKDTYLEILNQNLQNNSFSGINENGKKGYKLNLSSEELKNISIKLLEALKNDQVTLDKINEYVKIQRNSNKITSDNIDDIIKEISQITEEFNIGITVYQESGETSKILIENEEINISIEKIKEENELQYNIVIEQIKDGKKESTIYFNAKYNELQTMQNINENYELGIEFTADANTSSDVSYESDTYSYKYNLKNDISFQETSSIDDFSQEDNFNLNSLTEERRLSFMNALTQRLIDVNKKQMEQLGLSENENPLINMIPTLYIYNILGDSVTDETISEIEEAEISAFNSKFELYQGTNIGGGTVKGLLTTITTNNKLDEDEDEISESIEETNNKEENLIKEINFNGEEYQVNKQTIALLKGEILTEDYFRVEFEKDEDTGRIYRVVINKK